VVKFRTGSPPPTAAANPVPSFFPFDRKRVEADGHVDQAMVSRHRRPCHEPGIGGGR
jgi:hypothetical protein